MGDVVCHSKAGWPFGILEAGVIIAGFPGGMVQLDQCSGEPLECRVLDADEPVNPCLLEVPPTCHTRGEHHPCIQSVGGGCRSQVPQLAR